MIAWPKLNYVMGHPLDRLVAYCPVGQVCSPCCDFTFLNAWKIKIHSERRLNARLSVLKYRFIGTQSSSFIGCI